jgi:hypothetical protein
MNMYLVFSEFTSRPISLLASNREDDLRKLNVKNWWTVAKDRESWKKILVEAEAHIGL